MKIPRRDALVRLSLLLPLALGVLGCKKEPRCKHCGMKIDSGSPWRTDLVLPDGSAISFDTPRCAFTSWRKGATTAAGARAQDYYDRSWKKADDLRFVLGGDVVGPMGPDLVPVDPARAMKFIQDHGADRALRHDEVTLEVLSSMK
jgi:copper chaperone NosL